MEFSLTSEKETSKLAEQLAGLLQPGDILCLTGELGAGKTTLARHMLRALGTDGAVPSPTFTLMQEYETDAGRIYHCDFYRLTDDSEAVELGIPDLFADAVAFLEWPQNLSLFQGTSAPAGHERLDIALDFGEDEHGRIITLKGSPEWQARLETGLKKLK